MTTTSIHRYLDEAFVGVPVTPESQDLKEELRGNLSARVAELELGGTDAAAAVTTAVRELGDIRDLLASLDGDSSPAGLTHRVRPKPLFVLLTVVLSLALAKCVTWVTLGALGLVPELIAVAFAIGAAISIGALVTLALRQETSQHFPMPAGRALLFGTASLVGMLGLALGAALIGANLLFAVILGVPLSVFALLGFVWLGVTQTNRLKPWALEEQRQQVADDPFTKNPAVAARFGIYTVVIWVVAIALFVVLSLTVGFLWSWLALIAGFAVFFITLAHMMGVAARER